MRFKWGDLAENVSWCSHASNVLLSRSITSTTPENMKELLETDKQSQSHFPAPKIPMRICVKLPFGDVAKNRLLYITSFGSITKGRRLRYLQCWSRSASSSHLCIYDLEKVIQLFNGWAIQLQNKTFSAFGCLVCWDYKLFRAGTVSY